jgi:predicted Zn-dependent protease
MKQWGAFAIILLLLGAALITSQKQRINAPVSPEAVLSLVADTEQELTRLPVTFTRMSDQEEIKIGNELAKEYRGLGGDAKHAATTRVVQAYVDRVGRRVAAGAHRKLPYRFHYVADPSFVNAFALPGGHVFIGGGMMALMDSEDELANVLGHEVEHIDHYHCAERVQTQAAVHKYPLDALVMIPVVVFEAGYSKTQELEADREGTRLAVKAGYSPLGAVRLFQTFDQLFQAKTRRAQSPQEELSALALETLEGYFRSHPLPSERIAQIQELTSDEHWDTKTSELPLEVEYVYLTERASRELAARNFAAAESAAARSLGLHGGQTDALTVLAEAQFALMEFPAGLASYRQVLAASSPDAGAVGEFANNIAMGALTAQHFDQAAKFASASLDLQPDNAKALTVLADAQIAMSDYSAAGATYQRLLNLYPADAVNIVTYAASTARRALDAQHGRQALDAAAFWLTLQPRARDAFAIEASAEMALGDFSAAAKTYRNLLDLTPKRVPPPMQLVWSYADALSAANLGHAAVQDFRSFMITDRNVSAAISENQIRIEHGGLSLTAGDSAPASELVGIAERVGVSRISPEVMGRLGWWYYRAAKYSEAEALLRRLAQERPGDERLQNDLAWAELEQGEFETAIQRFIGAERFRENGSAQWNTPQMGLAVARWKSHRVDDALKNYASAAKAEPRWTNPVLVRAFYSPQVFQSVTEMQAEETNRLEARNSKRLAPTSH